MRITHRQTPPTAPEPNKQKRIPALVIALGAAVIGGISLIATLDKMQPAEPSNPPAAEVDITTTKPKPSTTRTTTTTRPTTTTTQTAEPLSVLPLSNNVVAEFGTAPVWNETLQSYRLHQAVDFGGEIGDKVVAIADATVLSVGQDTLWGGQLELDCGYGVVVRYSGVTTDLTAGETVKVGQAVGTLSGVPGESEGGVHLHVEMTADGQPIDVMKAIEK